VNRISKRLLFGVVTITVIGLAAVDAAPSASGQADDSSTITVGTVSDQVERVNGWSGQAPSSSEAAAAASTNDGSGGSPAEAATAESVIGADGRTQTLNTTTFPARAVGQIEFHQSQGLHPGDFICTGWLIDRNSILTSGHCAWDPPILAGGGGGGSIESATFFPGRNGGSNPFGSCPVTSLWVPPTEWAQNNQPYYDFAVMNFANPGTCAAIGDTTGWFGVVALNDLNALNNMPATVRGYPGDKPFGTHWTMSGRIAKANKRMTFYPMDTFGGQSGSPVYRVRSQSAPFCQGPCGMAIHGYGVGLPGPGQNNNAGPRLTSFRLGQIHDFADDNGV
jgi:glutamyl endopeptidase